MAPITPARYVQGVLGSVFSVLSDAKQNEAGVRQGPSRFRQDFEPLELLGRGAFGEVWRCRHRLDGREYAVKAVKYRIDTPDDGHLRHRVLREAQTWARLSHPNIVRYHSSWVEVEQASHPAHASTRSLPSPRASSMRSAPASWAYGGSPRSFLEEGSHGGVTFGELSSDALQLPTMATSPTAVGRTSRPTFGLPPATRVGVRDRPSEYVATLYIQTELCSKGTVQTWIEKRNLAFASSSTTLEEKQKWNCEASTIFSQVASAVAEMHQVGCAHRDIKPSNILFDRTGRVQLGDFGLAKEMSTMLPLGTDGVVTHEDSVLLDGEELPHVAAVASSSSMQTRGVGTPAYASPQQLTEGKYGVETDVFSLGVVLAELACPVGTHMERARLIEGLRHGHCLPASMSAALPITADLVLAMTDPEPARRPTAAGLLGAMTELMLEMQRPGGADPAAAQLPHAHERAELDGQRPRPAELQLTSGHDGQEPELPSGPGDMDDRRQSPGAASRGEEGNAEAEEAKLECPDCQPRKTGSCSKTQGARAELGQPADLWPAWAAHSPCGPAPLLCRKLALVALLCGLDRLHGFVLGWLPLGLCGASHYEGTADPELLTTIKLGTGLELASAPDHRAVGTDPPLYGSHLLLMVLVLMAVTLGNVCPRRLASAAGVAEDAGHGCAHLHGVLGSLWQ
mmetsp:Transcript_71327/g.209080  ORF Transcript_71327/g.209080 Transcript_71327/m.209080 type:complete len:683 (-) Transcript_71327:136-2184(-)